jgi:hypothetical protein
MMVMDNDGIVVPANEDYEALDDATHAALCEAVEDYLLKEAKETITELLTMPWRDYPRIGPGNR